MWGGALQGDMQPKLTPLPQDWTVGPCDQPHREGDPSSKRGRTPDTLTTLPQEAAV